MELTELTISEIHPRLKKKEFSALDLCKAYLEKIKEKNEELFAFLTVSENLALSQAKRVDELISKKKDIPLLAGIPFAVKDIILVKGLKCTAGSKILENYLAPYNATIIERLQKAGAVILGKTNLDEFVRGSSTENSAFGPTKNPHDSTRVPGGSSGGSAAAVAANLSCFALGTDTGGSIRQPASLCGIVGLKPTYGAVSRYGLVAFASSLDQIGPLAKSVEDAKIVFETISGKDEKDSTSVEIKKREKGEFDIKKIRFGIPKEYFIKGIDSEVEEIIRGAIKKYEEMGAEIKEISLPHTGHALPVYYIINPSEASANLARYDGIKYGFSLSKKGKDLFDVYFQSRGKGFGSEVRRRIMIGTYVLSSGYYDAYYLKAQKVRTLVKQDFDKAFKEVDLILTPTSPTPAFKLGEKVSDPLSMYLSDIYTVAVNIAGLPGLSLPCGKAKNSLPVGLQIIGQPFEEEKVFQAGLSFEKS
jgi:aspartyl-tRNA(Asn)/glutamyl-tRNA(Gln) amidotransferase subunit A